MSEMNVAPAARPVAVQPVAPGPTLYWKTPLLPAYPPELELEHFPIAAGSPGLYAPMSDDTTATWTLGRPGGSLSRVMKVGKFWRRLSCEFFIDDELSTMNRRSTLRLIACWNVFTNVWSCFSTGFSTVREAHAHSAGATAASDAQRNRRIAKRPVMRSSS